MDDKDKYRHYDEIVNTILTNILVERERCGKILLWDFNPIDHGDRLYFNRDYYKVMVVYHGIIVSEEDGLPMINDREMRAIAAYIAYALYFKEALRTKNKDTMALVQTLKEDWLRKCNAARIVDYLSQNDMDKILDVKSRWDRKQYGKSYKIAL